jgi:hypothetical protein
MASGGWAHRLLRRRALHPLLDPAESAQILGELKLQSPAKLLAEAAAWLDSALDPHTALDAAARLRIIDTIDSIARPSLCELELSYAGLRSAPAGRLQEWRVLVDYLERLLAASEALIEAPLRAADRAPSAEALDLLARTMRTATHRLCASWMRYLQPERSSFAILARCYSKARERRGGLAPPASGVDSSTVRPADELAAAVMLAAAEPCTLTPAEIALTAQIAMHCAGTFICSDVPDPRCRFVFDLSEGAPVRFGRQSCTPGALAYIGGGSALEWLRERLEHSRADEMPAPKALNAHTLAPQLTTRVIAHLLDYWSDDPPSRREPRTRVQAPVAVALGMPALKRALARAHDGRSVMLVRGDDAASANTLLARGLLLDFSALGVGARVSSPQDGSLEVRGIIGFRLDGSDKWTAARVRRLRSGAGDGIEAGAEIIGKAVSLVAIAPHSVDEGAIASDGVPAFQQLCIMVPEEPRLKLGPSLLLQPGTHRPGELMTLSSPAMVRCMRLGATMELIDGWERVAFEWAG